MTNVGTWARRRGRVGRLVIVLICALFASTLAADILYDYDAAGRLTGVVDASGNGARYNYDAVGNILTIDRFSSGSIGIFGFVPASGYAGQQVRITGIGFSPSTSQDTVKFNGTIAPVISATSNQVVVTVPAAATSGPITVTSPAGTATAPGVFTVAATPPANPSITGFSPTSGGSGDSVTISGSNFAASPSAETVTIGGVRATIASTTTTSIRVTVPAGAVTGPIGVSTTGGSAASSSNFNVLPGGYQSSEVGETVVDPGYWQSVTLTASDTSKVYFETFSGSAGDRVSVNFLDSGTGFLADGSVFGPDGSLVAGPIGTETIPRTNPVDPGYLIDPFVLPSTGTYTVVLQPRNGTTGSALITVYKIPPDQTGLLTSGTTVSLSLTAPGQKAIYTFTGSIGQRITAVLAGPSQTYTEGQFAILRPDGTSLYATSILAALPNGKSAATGTFTLDQAGTYSIVVDPYQSYVFSGSLTYYIVSPDPSTSLTSGSPATLTIGTPGQGVDFLFSGNAGQKISFNLSNALNNGGCTSIVLYNPDGTVLTTPGRGCGNPRFPDPIILGTQNGIYKFVVTADAGATGSITLTYYNVPPDPSATLTSGSPATLGIGTPDQGVDFLFSASAGQRFSFKLSYTLNKSVCVNATVYNPDGTVFPIPGTTCGSPQFFGPFTLGAQSGIYKVVVTADSGATGNATLTYYNVPPDPSTTLTSGSTATLAIGTPGQGVDFLFSAGAGQRISFNVGYTLNTNTCVDVEIYNPDGTNFSIPGGVCGSPTFLGPFTLGTQSGTYKVVVTAGNGATGNATLTYYNVPPDPTATLTNGSTATVTINTRGQGADFLFNASSGQKASFNLSYSLNPSTCANIVIYNPDGSVFNSPGLKCGSPASLGPYTLGPQSGTYKFVVTANGGPTGTVTNKLTLN